MYYLLSFLTVIINAVLVPIWYLAEKYGLSFAYKANDFQNIINLIITPLFLIILNIYFICNKGIKWYASIITVLFVISINSLIKYIDWGITTGLLLNPDAETVMVSIYVNTVFPLVITFIGLGAFGIIRWIKSIL